MQRMTVPSAAYADVLTACENEITGNNTLKNNLVNAKTTLSTSAGDYAARVTNATLYQLPQFTVGGSLVAGNLTKDALTNLYDYYFVKKRAGGYYDQFMIAANEKCPLCGIGQPANLDHFMPKGTYPQFSVLPVNLVPSCRDCNMGNKGSSFATTATEQILHPFLDADHFFNEQWIFATYYPAQNTQPSFLNYYVSPPQGWSMQDKERVSKHFLDFDIGKRYAIQASTRLRGIESQINALKLVDPTVDFKGVVLRPLVDNAPFVNHWERIMCLALINHL